MPLVAEDSTKKEASQKAQQATPKKEPRRPQWDTSLVNKARNAPRKPHQPQWSPAGAAARKVRPDSAKSTASAQSWTPPRVSLPQDSDPHRSPARAGGSPVKHPSPWTLEGESVLDKNFEDETVATEEEARCVLTSSTRDTYRPTCIGQRANPCSCATCIPLCASQRQHILRKAVYFQQLFGSGGLLPLLCSWQHLACIQERLRICALPLHSIQLS